MSLDKNFTRIVLSTAFDSEQSGSGTRAMSGDQSRIVSALLAVTTSSKDSAVILSGRERSGKTSILERVSEELGNRPHRLLRANPGQSTWPLSGLMSMLASVPLNEPVNLAAYIPNERTGEVDCYSLALEIQVKLLNNLETGSVILIDDADALDQDSQTVIGFLASRMTGTGTSLIASVTDPTASSAWSSIRHLELEPMDDDDSIAFLLRKFGTGASESVLRTVVNHADGRPGTLLDLMAQLTAPQVSGVAPLVLPLRQGATASHQLEAALLTLPGSQRRLLTWCAMASLVEPQALMVAGHEDLDSLEDLLAAGWLQRKRSYVEVSSQFTRSVLYWHGRAADRRARHKQLCENTKSPSLVAYHKSFGDTQEVLGADLYAAAQELIVQGHTEMGIELIERALLLGVFESSAVQCLVKAIEALIEVLELPAASRFVTLAKERATAPEVILDMARLTLELELLATSLPMTGEAEVTANKYSSVEPERSARLLCTVSLAHGLNDDAQSAHRALLSAETVFPEIRSSQMSRYQEAKLLLASMEKRVEPLLAEYRNAAATATRPIAASTALILGLALSQVGHHQEATRLFTTLLPAQGTSVVTLSQRLAQLFNAKNELRANRFGGAIASIEAWAKTPGPDLLEPLPQIIQAWYWLAKDRPELAVPFLDSARPIVTAKNNSRHVSLLAAIEGEHALMRDNTETAIAHFRRAQLVSRSSPDGHHVRMMANLIEALTLDNRFEEAAFEYRAAQSFLATAPGRRNRMVMRRAHAVARAGVTSLKLFRALIDEWRIGDSRFEHARLLHSYADRLVLEGHQEEARNQFLTARAIFTDMGAKGWAERTDSRLMARPVTTVVHPMAEKLNRDELKLIELLRLGRTNKEIAAELFIAVSTVEFRLGKVFKKTGVSNRHHLVSLFTS